MIFAEANATWLPAYVLFLRSAFSLNAESSFGASEIFSTQI
jgi:hypothetical protein